MQYTMHVLSFILLALFGSQQRVPARPSQAPEAKPAAGERVDPRDEKTAAKEQIAAALARAKAENRRVLLLWSASWSGACTKLDECCGLNVDANYERMYEYVVLRVDVGTRELEKNSELAKLYGGM